MTPENTFIAKVHKLLPTMVYREKMHNPYRGGTPDVWYSGAAGDLWIEYKYLAKLPKSSEILPNLSKLQHLWLNSRLAEGRNVAVIVGHPAGGVIYENRTWGDPLVPAVFEQQTQSLQTIADFIVRATTGESLCSHLSTYSTKQPGFCSSSQKSSSQSSSSNKPSPRSRKG